ncbi:hypothetical protein SAMN04515671_4126 [Nakamurella panacisegetis]|uniref:Winged helix-turn-helix domain-containing protein n=1 Tax=Nakamurella panacisegetis TaxID=1090615 RepID=A0A1H0SIR4_9ACTN|nr:hypothetical protein SAMN04515671_4126 [Nakamurella panacisegetis]
MPQLQITAAQARRTAIAAQGLSAPLPAAAGAYNRGHLRRLVDRIGLLQIDSVNVLARAHYLPLFSRLGQYRVDLLAGAAWPARPADRTLLETWAHEASLVPIELQPLLRWRQRKFVDGPWSSAAKLRAEHPGFLEDVLAVVRDHGPLSAGEIEKVLEAPGRGKPGWWEWSATKTASEYLFAVGAIGTSFRRGFERVYDLTERILPAAVLATPTPAEFEAKKALIARSARAHGIGTVGDLADYYRIRNDDAKRALLELVEDGDVLPVQVRGWRDIAFLHRDAKMPRKVTGRALLCPFDPLIWERARTERLFDFRYRIEIYTPAPKRVYGYYVFPLLVGDELVGRFDLKSDRATGRLLVQAAWHEPGTVPGEVAQAASAELSRMARWLDLDEVAIMPRGNLHGALAAAM